MKKLLLIINTITFLSGLGVETLNIPPTANAVGTSGAGIASPLDIWINPVGKNGFSMLKAREKSTSEKNLTKTSE